MNIRMKNLHEKLGNSRKIVDLGCGNNPVQGASTAVDCHLEPNERAVGHGAHIDLEAFAKKGIRFVNQRIDLPLPFADREFDFAFSSHAFEHLDDPATACREMMRIAKSGAIITPSVFAEIAFGRHYHKWLVMDRLNTLFFFPKRDEEDCPFGEHPEWDHTRGWFASHSTNPFDIFLNDGDWYSEREGLVFDTFRKRLRKHWYDRSVVSEVIFIWEESFNFLVL